MWLGREHAAATWEPASSLPQQLIVEYEAGVLREVYDITHCGGGQTAHTLASKSACEVPASKRPRQEPSELLSTISGY